MKIWIIILIGVVIIGIIGTVCAYFFVYNKPHPDYEKAEAAYTLPAQELYSAFITNKTDAEKKFNGQVVSIDGTLKKMEIIDSLVIAVFVYNQGVFGDEGIRCTMLPKFNASAKTLQPSRIIKIKGLCTGFNDTDVILEKCSILNQ